MFEKKHNVAAGVSIVLTVTITVMIYLFSAESGDNSSDLSIRITRFISKLVFFDYGGYSSGQQIFLVEALNGFIRKLGHFGIFGLLGVLSSASGCFLFRKHGYALIFPATYCVMVALADELHQLFVTQREGKISDVLIDCFGATCGFLAVYLVASFIIYIKNESKRRKQKDDY